MRSAFRTAASLLVCLLGAWVAATASAAPTVVSMLLEPEQITIGDSAQLTVTMLGGGNDELTLPVVAGLDFRVIEKYGRVERIHGAAVATTTLTLRVTPHTAGVFTIPALSRDVQPLVLRVNRDETLAKAGASARGAGAAGAASEAGGAAAGGVGRAGRVPVLAESATAADIRLTPDGSAFLRLIMPKRVVYVGESVPVDIELGGRPGLVQTLNGLPSLTNAEFTFNNLNRPERSERLVGGKPFIIMTWHTVLAPVKPGAFTLAVAAPITVKIRTRPAQDAKIDDLLGDPFLQNIFGPSIKKDIQVESPPVVLNVAPLPSENQPAGFTGAVGSFQVASELSATTAAAGDPLTLRLRVTGSGNFDRVDSAMLEHLDHWKTYPPRATLKSTVNASPHAEKVFEQPLIAARAGVQTLPGLVFSYFDPTMGRYETVRTAPLSVTITPAAADAPVPEEASRDLVASPNSAASPNPAAAGNSAATANADAATNPDAAAAGLRPDHAVTSARVTSLRPLYLRPTFLALPALLSLGFFGARWRMAPRERVARRRASALDRELKRAAARALQRVRDAAAAGDPDAFFQAAALAAREGLAARWQLPPGDITPAVVAARQGDEATPIAHLLTLADETAYGRRSADRPDFVRWIEVVRAAWEAA
jgi:hypothetical protein